MGKTLAELGKQYSAWERSDRNDFQRRARILQSMWREEQGYPMGEHRGRPFGSRLRMPRAQQTLENYLTEEIGKLVEGEVRNAGKTGKLYAQPRIFDELLSSQPMCFNLFGELERNPDLATSVFHDLTGGRAKKVTAMKFEHSPGRRDANYTGDRSAFDVYVEYETQNGRRGFLGIEAKYHEHIDGVALEHRERYLEIAKDMSCFRQDAFPPLLHGLEQIWRDHLLAGSMIKRDGFREGCFVFLYPEQNHSCRDGIAAYRQCLLDEDSLASWTIEDVVAEIRRHCSEEWIHDFQDRYLAFEKLEVA